MADLGLIERIEQCCADYTIQTGKSFSHFFCPILHCDDDTELCRGHVVNEALAGSAWVPQRKDVDNFYGSVVEADLVSLVEDRKKDSFEIIADKKTRSKHRPRIEFGGETCQYYFPKAGSPLVSGHSTIALVKNESEFCHFAIKMDKNKLIENQDKKFELIFEKDYRASVIASMLKAAHLSLFMMLGYKSVFVNYCLELSS